MGTPNALSPSLDLKLHFTSLISVRSSFKSSRFDIFIENILQSGGVIVTSSNPFASYELNGMTALQFSRHYPRFSLDHA